MSRYNMLVNVLDGIRNEALNTKFNKLYAIDSESIEDLWSARARAYIHLYIKVMFGVTDFCERETYVTDGSRDGGIDGYFIDSNKKTIYIIQSKFRNTENNFENKPIEYNEILAMQIRRILGGDIKDLDGFDYNGKILGLQRRISEIADLGRYKYQVVLIANLELVKNDDLRKLSDNFDVELYNYNKSYSDLLYPVISGTLFKATDINISLDLSNKSAGAKIMYSVDTKESSCNITLVFVPTLEVARLMSNYKNSILRHNPRSYLEFSGERVNNAIRETIVSARSNEFAIFNNGITIICDESGVNEQSGRKNRAQLFLLNPQIINGGQTAYTLSRIYDDPAVRNELFEGKEVLVKAISVASSDDKPIDFYKQLELIEKISFATNSQTAVTIADRTSNDEEHNKIQKILYDNYGLLYERKRGEFSDGLKEGYIDESLVIERLLFARIFLASNGNLPMSTRRKLRIEHLKPHLGKDLSKFERFVVGYNSYRYYVENTPDFRRIRLTAVLPKIYAACIVSEKIEKSAAEKGKIAAKLVESKWSDFEAQSNSFGVGPQLQKNLARMDRRQKERALAAKPEATGGLRQFFSHLD